MKTRFFVIALVAALLFGTAATVSAKAEGDLNTETPQLTLGSAAQTSGATAGSALNTLFKNYLATKKIELGNTSNILALTSLATSITGLKGQKKGSGYFKDFGKGLVLGSAGLVTNSTAATTTSTLQNLAEMDFSSLLGGGTTNGTTTEQTQQSQADATSIISTLTSLFGSLKK